MADEIDWAKEVAEYDCATACIETRAMWLKLGRSIKEVLGSSADWLGEGLQQTDEAMRWAARAEACLWRATGDAAGIDADRFIPEMRTIPTNEESA